MALACVSRVLWSGTRRLIPSSPNSVGVLPRIPGSVCLRQAIPTVSFEKTNFFTLFSTESSKILTTKSSEVRERKFISHTTSVKSHPCFRPLCAANWFPLLQVQQKRSLIKFSFRKGKRKTVKPVLKRFKRLDWGIWVRPMQARAKRLWKKTPDERERLKWHVFCNRQQSRLLNHMVTKYWKKKRHYVNDIYEPYQRRTNVYRGVGTVVKKVSVD